MWIHVYFFFFALGNPCSWLYFLHVVSGPTISTPSKELCIKFHKTIRILVDYLPSVLSHLIFFFFILFIFYFFYMSLIYSLLFFLYIFFNFLCSHRPSWNTLASNFARVPSPKSLEVHSCKTFLLVNFFSCKCFLLFHLHLE